MGEKDYFERLVLDENIDFLVEKKLESKGFEFIRLSEGAKDRDLIEYCVKEGLPLLTEDNDFKTDIITIEHPGILFDRYLSRRDTKMVVNTLEEVLSTYDKETLSNEVWHLSDFYGRNNF